MESGEGSGRTFGKPCGAFDSDNFKRLKKRSQLAASNRAVGVTSLAKCAFVRSRKQKGPLGPIWYDEQCRLKRNLFIAAVKCGEAQHACQFLRKKSRSVTEETNFTSLVATTAWNEHLQSHFRVQPTVVPQEGGRGCSTRTARFACLSGRDMAVLVDRNHAPQRCS
eukprot:553521-Pelagomonas_calceolata.AAC.1